jgi:hypothetical protein
MRVVVVLLFGRIPAALERQPNVAEAPQQGHGRAEQRQRQRAQPVDDLERGDAGGEHEAHQEQRGQPQRPAGLAESKLGVVGDQQPESAADPVRQLLQFLGQMHVRERGPRRQQQQESRPAQRQPVQLGLRLQGALPEDQISTPGDHQRQQVSERPQQEQRHIREPGPDRPGGVVDAAVLADE